jgi:hypothetical protein
MFTTQIIEDRVPTVCARLGFARSRLRLRATVSAASNPRWILAYGHARATMVEAPVGEDCQVQAGDDYVRLSRKGAHVPVYPPPSAKGFPDGGAEPRLQSRP